MPKPNFDKIISYNLIDEFAHVLDKKKHSQDKLYDIASCLIIYSNETFQVKELPNFWKILILDHGFEISNRFIMTHYVKIARYRLDVLFIDILGDKFFVNLDYDAIGKIIFVEHSQGRTEIITKIIEQGFDINNIRKWVKERIVEKSNGKKLKILKLMLDNGLNLEFVDKNLISRLIWTEHINTLKLLEDHGIDITLVNDVKIPPKFNNYYNFLLDLGVEPNKITYIMSHGDFDSNIDSESDFIYNSKLGSDS